MNDREKVIKGLEDCIENNCRDCPYPCYCEYADDWPHELHKDALELLKELDDRQKKWLETISDNQLSIGGADPLTDYEQGMWDGLQMAYEILTEEDSVK